MSSGAEIQVLPKCPDCGRLTVDNVQHCGEKKPLQWATHCRWMVCRGTTSVDGKVTKCQRVYGPPGWPGWKGR